MQQVDESSNNFLEHFLKIGSGTVITIIVGLITTPIITRIVKPYEYGQLSIFQMYTNIAVMVLCLGLDQALVRFFYDSDSRDYKKALIKFCVLLPLSITVLSGAFFLLIVNFSNIKFEFNDFVSLLLVINILLALLNRMAILVLRVTYDSGAYSIASILYRIFYVVFAIFLVELFPSHSFDGLCIGVIMGYFISTLYSMIRKRSYWSFKNNYKLKNRLEILKFGLPFILSMGLTQLFEALDKISINYFCDYSDVGIYSSAMSIINIFAVVQTTFNAVWGPMQVEHYVKDPDNTEFIKKGNQLITVIMFAIGLSLILLRNVFVLLLGKSFRGAAQILPFLIFNPVMYTISETTCSGIGVSKKSYLNIIVALGACICNFIGNTILVPLIGPRGAAISTGFSYFVFWLLRTVFSNKYYYVDYSIEKFLLITLISFGYAFYNTFFYNSLISIIIYFVCILILCLLYKKSIVMGVEIFRKQFQQLKNRKAL